MALITGSFDNRLLDRMVRAVELVRERLIRSTSALDAAGVPHCVVGGNAVAAWVARVDPGAVRNTADVDLLIRREDYGAAELALATAGFIHRHAAGIDFFQDGREGRFRDAVHVVPANEKVRTEYLLPAPDVSESERGELFQVVSLEALVRMKLTSFRDKDKTHLRDLLELDLVEPGWVDRFPAELGARLQQLIDTPEG